MSAVLKPAPAAPSRRAFMKRGAALTIGFSLAPALNAQQAGGAARLPGSLQGNRMLNAWLAINKDGSITILTGKVELGQGITTALVQIAADELDVDTRRIQIVSGDTAKTPNEGVTAGSLSIQDSGTALRFACAEAREMLFAAAAAKLGVRTAALSVDDGVVSNPAGQKVAYWELIDEAMFRREATARAKPKTASELKIVGREMKRRDSPAKVTGGEAYVHDMRLPGMVFGRVVRPPSPRARLVSLDEAAVRKLPGVVAVVRDGNFLGVAAEREEQAIAAAQAMRKAAKWEEKADLPPMGPALFERMKTQRSQDSVVSNKDGPAPAANARVFESHYTRPFQSHGSIGPSCAVAVWKDDKLSVWSHSQGVFPLRGDMAKALRVPEANITVTHREGSGCYGHNGADDVALDAALVARAARGRPVKLQWMREDEFGWEPYGSAMAIRMKAALDETGRIVDWEHELWSHTHSTRPYDPDGCNLLAAWHLANPVPPAPARNIPQPAGGSDRNAIPLYAFPRQKVTNHLLPDMPVRVSALRTLGAYANVFALESFMDELAAAAGEDPVAFRLKHLTDPRARAVIESAAAKAGWQAGTTRGLTGDAPAGVKRGRGIGFSKYKNLACYCAVVADVEIDAAGKVHVKRAVCTAEAGRIVNPDGFRNQIEGGIIQSTSWTVLEAVQYDATRMTIRTWADYPVLRFGEIPAVEVTLLNRPDDPSLGVGEGSQGPAVAAIANAVAHATGKRLRDLPLTPARVKPLLA
jgi:CO/xanthine dehydrogenase Mo-binding subunit